MAIPQPELDLDMPIPPLPEMHDGRTPEELFADGDNRWPYGTFAEDPHDHRRLYLPKHLKGRELKRFMHKLILIEIDKVPLAPARGDEVRVSGQVCCGTCELPLHDHPADPLNPHLTVTCDRTRVKT